MASGSCSVVDVVPAHGAMRAVWVPVRGDALQQLILRQPAPLGLPPEEAAVAAARQQAQAQTGAAVLLYVSTILKSRG